MTVFLKGLLAQTRDTIFNACMICSIVPCPPETQTNKYGGAHPVARSRAACQGAMEGSARPLPLQLTHGCTVLSMEAQLAP
jgi:hypothetical protein